MSPPALSWLSELTMSSTPFLVKLNSHREEIGG
jgi:hypothetical protein